MSRYLLLFFFLQCILCKDLMPTLDSLFQPHQTNAAKEPLLSDVDFARFNANYKNKDTSYAHVWSGGDLGNVLDINWDPTPPKIGDTQKDLVQPNETHLEGVPYFLKHPKPLYYTLKSHPATIECIAEPVSHAVIECAEQVIPYKGPEEPGRLKVTRLNSENHPDPNGKRWKLELQVKAREVEEWFDSYVCRCEVWNKVVELQRPKKVVSRETAVVEAYMDRKFQLEPVSSELVAGTRLVLTCIPPKGKPDPEVYWLKDGKRVRKESFPHILLNDYNHLIIENASIADSGNYTCVAECLGLEYRYATATVAVRATASNHPTTLLSPSPVPHSKWGTWTKCAWTTTETTSAVRLCQQKRYHLRCAQYETPNDDRLKFKSPIDCQKLNEQIRNCSVSECSEMNDRLLNNEDTIQLPNETPDSHVFVHEFTIYSSLFLLLIILVAFVICLAVRKKYAYLFSRQLFCFDCCLPGKKTYVTEMRGISVMDHRFKQAVLTKDHSSFEERPLIYDVVSSMELGSTRMVEPGYSVAQYDTPQYLLPPYQVPGVQPLMINPSLPSRTPSIQQTTSQHMMMYPPVLPEHESIVGPQPMIQAFPMFLGKPGMENDCKVTGVPSNFNSSEHSSGHTVITTGTGSRNTGSSDGSLCPGPRDMTYEPIAVDTGDFVPPNPYQYASVVDEPDEINPRVTGKLADGLITLDSSGVTLRIPMDLRRKNGDQPVYLSLFTGDMHLPELKDTQTKLTPVVCFGPSTLDISTPVVLSIPHCAELNAANWTLRLLYSSVDHANGEPSLELTNVVNHPPGNDWKELISMVYNDSERQDLSTTPGVACHIEQNVLHVITSTPGRYCVIGESQKGPLSNTESPVARKSLILAAFTNPSSPTTMDRSVRIYVLNSTPDALDYVRRSENHLNGQFVAKTKQLMFANDGSPMCFMITTLPPGWCSKLPHRTQEIPFRHIWNGTQTATLHCAFNLERLAAAAVADSSQNACLTCEIRVFQASQPNQAQLLLVGTEKQSVTSTNNIEEHSPKFRLHQELKKTLCDGLLGENGWKLLANELALKCLIPNLSTYSCPVAILLELLEGSYSDSDRKMLTLERIIRDLNLPSYTVKPPV